MPHRNPALCAISSIGLLLLYRFLVLREPFPSVRDAASYKRRALLRADKTLGQAPYVSPVSAEALLPTFKKLYQNAGVETQTGDPFTHHGRHQSQMEAATAMVPEPEANIHNIT